MTLKQLLSNIKKFTETKKKVKLKETQVFKTQIDEVADIGFYMTYYEYTDIAGNKWKHKLRKPIYLDFKNGIILIHQTFTERGFENK